MMVLLFYADAVVFFVQLGRAAISQRIIHQPQAAREIYYNITTAGTINENIRILGAVATAVTVQRKL